MGFETNMKFNHGQLITLKYKLISNLTKHVPDAKFRQHKRELSVGFHPFLCTAANH